MASKQRSADTQRIPLTLHERTVGILEEQLRSQAETIRTLQRQMEIFLDDKFFRPDIATKADPRSNQLADPLEGGDQPEFEVGGDALELGTEQRGGDLNAEIDKIASEHGVNWREEHA